MKENNYLTHGIHSYHAKFIPAIPIEFLNRFSKEGDIVLDPFCGSGTTLLECLLSNHISYGVDMSDIAFKISRAKVFLADPVVLDVLYRDLMDKYNSDFPFNKTIFPDKYVWFSKSTADCLDRIFGAIKLIEIEDYRNVFEVIFSSILKTVCNKRETWNNGYIADNVLPNKEYNGDALKVFARQFAKVKKSYEELYKISREKKVGSSTVLLSNILDFKSDILFDIVITSPPYPFAVDFVRYNRLTYYWFGWDLNEKFEEETGSRGKRNRKNAINDFFNEMEKIYKHIFSLVKSGGYFCMTVGDTAREKNKISFVSWLINLFTNNGWELIVNETREIIAQSMAQKRIPTEQKIVFRKK